MPDPVIAVSDSAFPDLKLAQEVLSRIGAELRMADQNTPAGIMRVAQEADALLVTYAQITAAMIRQMRRCRARTMAGGLKTHNIFLPIAEFEPVKPKGDEEPPMKPNTFGVILVAK